MDRRPFNCDGQVPDDSPTGRTCRRRPPRQRARRRHGRPGSRRRADPARVGRVATTVSDAALTGGTDNHLLLIVVRPFGLNGRQAEATLRAAGITSNRNVVPNDPNGAWYTSGLRLGTAAVTTLGMGAHEMLEIGATL